ncbi:conserved hypothetical protein [Coccidioides posadasii C735 delta SOWgp]|uniref:Uncharacterized protein n=4 Tax=Coccidioides posadasii TaxID=199306 RepID=E9D5J1_COCPS|nr:conserved hypothetical protein [Coccidioides posadasii C735 delta SOWgp]EER24623.1 conserved hypothetical protein [Coccidioides posadasii C735 delta SOWgp]EFW18185.1 conserved hypothetical protein [Coccidioides posadasii str. Silveira]KMM66423.1 hypothetical protein CPAG_02762 [Coccidioides posadasii RMSCC 3488]|eukprot:XP_003066768.1 conserved hypothetical protein [Coccidioides posadasii C735 delta SOWgp]
MFAERPTTLPVPIPSRSAMSPPIRSNSPTASSRPRSRHSSKASPALHLGNLPRFHPAVYQSSNPNNHFTQSPSPNQQRPSLSSREALRQYRELIASIALTPRNPASTPGPRPAKPRLAPIGSPGPVTPLSLEEQDDSYFTATPHSTESTSRGDHPPPQEVLERLLERENERIASTSGSRTEKKAR